MRDPSEWVSWLVFLPDRCNAGAGTHHLVRTADGVGEHFQGETFYIASNEMSEAQRFDLLDHPTIFVPYLATNDSFTIDGIGRGDKAEIESK